jgi:hypothetical protein
VTQIRLWRQRTSGFIYTPELVPLEPVQYALCDDADYPWLSHWEWYLIRNDPYRYAHCVLYVSPDECRIETMHRMVMEASAERTTGSLGTPMATTSKISAAICTKRNAGGDRREAYLAGWAYQHLAPAPTRDGQLFAGKKAAKNNSTGLSEKTGRIK